jgi:hypothetical protein
MTSSDLLHAILLLVGLCVGLAIGSHHGLAGAIIGAGAGFLVGHLLAVGLTVLDLVIHGIGRWWLRR